MSSKRSAQFQTETPFLPQPLAGDVLQALLQSFATIEDGEALQVRIATALQHVAAAIDTIELALRQNHADYLGGRRAWSYDTRIEVDTRLRILKRQRQHVQEAYGQCNRRLKRLVHLQEGGRRTEDMPEASRAVAFVQAATQMLDPETVRLIWEIVEHRQSQRGAAGAP